MPNLARIKKICRSVAYALCARLRLSEVYSVNKFNIVSNCLINSSRMITDRRNSRTLKRLVTLLNENIHFVNSVDNISDMVTERNKSAENTKIEQLSVPEDDNVRRSSNPFDVLRDCSTDDLTPLFQQEQTVVGSPSEVSEQVISIIDEQMTDEHSTEHAEGTVGSIPTTPIFAMDEYELTPDDIDFLFNEGLPILGFTDKGLKNIIITGFSSIKDLFMGFIGVITSDNYSILTKHFIKTIGYKIHRILVSLRRGITIPREFFNPRINNKRIMLRCSLNNNNQSVDDVTKLLKHRDFILTNMKAIETREDGMVYDEKYEQIIADCKTFIEQIIKCVSREFELVSKYHTIVTEAGEMINVPDKEQTDMINYDILERIEEEWDDLDDSKNSFVYYVCFRELYRFTHNVSIIMKNIKPLNQRTYVNIQEHSEDSDDDMC